MNLENALRQTAQIVGKFSASNDALRKLESERALGKIARIEKRGQTLFVISETLTKIKQNL